MEDNLLDNNNIESVYKSSFLQEILKVEVWLSVLVVLGFLVGLGVGIAGVGMFAADTTEWKWSITGAMVLIQSVLFIYWSYIAFDYTKAVKWYNPKNITNRLEHLLEKNSQLWRATAMVFSWLLCLFGTAALVGIFG